MKYIAKIDHYETGKGYTHTETAETGEVTETFSAAEWVEDEEIQMETETGWKKVWIEFYELDPLFHDPVYTTYYRG